MSISNGYADLPTVGVDDIENKFFTALGQYLEHPDGLAKFHDNLQKMKAKEAHELACAKRKLMHVQRNIDSIINAITEGLYTPSMKEKMLKLEADKDSLNIDIQCYEDDSNVIDFLPNIGETYEKRIKTLRMALDKSFDDRHKAV